jgi:hypothetical protein
MGKKRKQGRCIFCPHEGELTVEDALPKWIGRAFARRSPEPPGDWTTSRVRIRPGQPDQVHTKKVGNPSVYKLPVVCRECNGGWMKALEDEVKPFLEGMIFGDSQGIELSRDQEHALAVWATKTAILYDLLEPDTTIAALFPDYYREGSNLASSTPQVWTNVPAILGWSVAGLLLLVPQARLVGAGLSTTGLDKPSAGGHHHKHSTKRCDDHLRPPQIWRGRTRID